MVNLPLLFFRDGREVAGKSTQIQVTLNNYGVDGSFMVLFKCEISMSIVKKKWEKRFILLRR